MKMSDKYGKNIMLAIGTLWEANVKYYVIKVNNI